MVTSGKDASLIVLGIETSCDETAAAVVRRAADGRGEILSNVVRSQLDLHAAYGGVVPEIAARAHVELLDPAISQALADAVNADPVGNLAKLRPVVARINDIDR